MILLMAMILLAAKALGSFQIEKESSSSHHHPICRSKNFALDYYCPDKHYHSANAAILLLFAMMVGPLQLTMITIMMERMIMIT